MPAPRALLGLLLVTLPGCFLFAKGGMVQERVLKLEKYEVRGMRSSLANDATSLCPGNTIQMTVQLDLRQLKNKKLGTVQMGQAGTGDAKFWGVLGAENFNFDGRGGSVDAEGLFRGSADHMETAASGFTVGVQLKTDPKKYSKIYDLTPTYCVSAGGAGGMSGSSGSSGSQGDAGAAGENGGEEKVGGAAGSGGQGGPGGNASPGSPGPHVIAFVTAVKTPFFDKLVLVEFGGEAQGRQLFDATKPIELYAVGGNGGQGGSGGSGGSGGKGGDGVNGGAGGAGGSGGSGGSGADGGPGGKLEVIVDPEQAWAAELISPNVNGGGGGYPGDAGRGGSGGAGGATTLDEGGQKGADGPVGPDGVAGTGAGQAGPPGEATVVVGPVDAAFVGLPREVERLSP